MTDGHTSLVYTDDDGTRIVLLDLDLYLAAVRRGSPVPPSELGRRPAGRRSRCGTVYGYRLHQDHGEQPCALCLCALNTSRRVAKGQSTT